MGKSLYELYINNPGNYIVSGIGGVGKTTQLLNMMKQMLFTNTIVEKSVTYVPIYIRIKDFNTMSIKAGILYKVIGKYFNNTVDEKKINDMFESSNSYRFLILIDGLNELRNYITDDGNGQPVLNYVINDIKKMNHYKNVDFIITLRNEDMINIESIFENYSSLKIEGLTKLQIDEYLGIDILDLEAHLREVLSIPMLLRIFGDIYKNDPMKATRLNTKYELLNEWLSLDTIYKLGEYEDIDDIFRCKVIKQVLPLFAFKVELDMLNQNLYSGSINYEKLLNSTLDDLKMYGIEREQIVKTINRTTLLIENNLIFTHDLIRECLATYCIVNCVDYLSKDDIELVFKRLNYYFSDDNENNDNLVRKRSFLDLGELIYGATQDKENGSSLIGLLISYGFNHKESIQIAYRYYFKLAGIFQELSERKMAYRIGWEAIELLPQVEENKSDFDKGFEYNYLYYCVNKYRDDENKNPKFLLDRAKCILDGIPIEEHTIEYKNLYSAVLSNMGSHYVSPYCHDPVEARKWHLKCLKYRKDMGLNSSLGATYRTLMTDCFYFGKEGSKMSFRYAYYYYCAAVKNITGTRKLSQTDGCNNVPMDIVIRAMGNEILILHDKTIPGWLELEIVKELPCQIKHVYKEAIKGRRHDFDTLKDLYIKMKELLEWYKIEEYSELKLCIDEYMKKEI